MEDLRVIDNLEQDRLREEEVAKEEEKRQREAARAERGDWGGSKGGGRMGQRGGAVIGSWKPLRRQVNEAGAS